MNGFYIILFISKKRTIMKDYPTGYSRKSFPFLLRSKWIHSTSVLLFPFTLFEHINELLDKGKHKQGMSYIQYPQGFLLDTILSQNIIILYIVQ